MSIRKGTTIIAGNSSPLDWTGTLQEYNIALENGTIKENMVCYITDDTLYTDDIRPEIETLNSVKANKDLSNLSEVGEKHFLNKSQITNCITEVPQNIKLELNDGVLTLKAGSKVIVPNGVGVFDEVITKTDKSITGYGSGTRQMVLLVRKSGGLDTALITNTFSGTNAPLINSIYYNTTENKVDYYLEGVAQGREYAFPVAIVTFTDDVITSIDQIFNGIGYIGSTVWVDKGVKCLIPNGRNEDGTLKNIELTTTEIKLRNDATNATYKKFVLYQNKNLGLGNGIISCKSYADRNTSVSYQLVEDINQTYVVNRTYIEPLCVIADITCDGTKVTGLTPKNTFRAVDYNDAVTKNTPHITETYVNGTSWYRVWSDGWIEQGGLVVINKTNSSFTGSVEFIKKFTNANYTITHSAEGTGLFVVTINDLTTSGFTVHQTGYSSNTAENARWYACGY